MEVQPHDTPSEVTAEAGEVLVDGPGGVALAFTPQAAEETSHRLRRGAADARAQRQQRQAARRG